jgi:hypothetical protein
MGASPKRVRRIAKSVGVALETRQLKALGEGLVLSLDHNKDLEISGLERD